MIKTDANNTALFLISHSIFLKIIKNIDNCRQSCLNGVIDIALILDMRGDGNTPSELPLPIFFSK